MIRYRDNLFVLSAKRRGWEEREREGGGEGRERSATYFSSSIYTGSPPTVLCIRKKPETGAALNLTVDASVECT